MNSKELAAYVADQLSGLPGVRSIPMMGGYIFYYREKIIGGIYEPGFLIKDVPAARVAMPDAELVPTEAGGKPKMLACTILEDRDRLRAMVAAMEPELPESKPRKKKG